MKAASKNWGATVYSKYVTDVTGKATLAKGAITKAQSWGYNGVKLSWQQIAGADGYRLYVKSSPNGTYSYVTQIRKGETTSYVHTGRTTGRPTTTFSVPTVWWTRNMCGLTPNR
ncbi:MAG: hypothetical protein ACLSEX_06935 [Blautia sp.]